VPGLRPEELDKQIGCAVADRGVLDKFRGRHHQDREFHELLQPVQIAEMLLRDSQCIERGKTRGFLAFRDRKIFTQPAGHRELPMHHRQHPAEEEQISALGGSGMEIVTMSADGCRKVEKALR
jgi:hypothetical protein